MTMPPLLEQPFFALAFLVSGILILHLWVRRRGSIGQKILWSMILMIPLLGALLYLAYYIPPPIQPEHDQAREHPDLWAAPSGHDTFDHHG